MRKYSYLMGAVGASILIVYWLTCFVLNSLSPNVTLKNSEVSQQNVIPTQTHLLHAEEPISEMKHIAEVHETYRKDLQNLYSHIRSLYEWLSHVSNERMVLSEQLHNLNTDVQTLDQNRGKELQRKTDYDDKLFSNPDPGKMLSGEERAQAQLDTLHDQLLAEEIDTMWSAWAEAEIAKAIEAPAFNGSTLMNMQCHSHLCRVAVGFADQATRHQVFRHLPTLMSWEGQGFYYIDEDSNTVVIYMAREGETFSGRVRKQDAYDVQHSKTTSHGSKASH